MGRPMILWQVSRETDHFDLGVEIGNLEQYCQTVVNFVMEAIAYEARDRVFAETPVYSYHYLTSYDAAVAHFAFVVGQRLDFERIVRDLFFVYDNLQPSLEQLYPNWNQLCPAPIRIMVTPGSVNFVVAT